jgi:hypothetical protein
VNDARERRGKASILMLARGFCINPWFLQRKQPLTSPHFPWRAGGFWDVLSWGFLAIGVALFVLSTYNPRSWDSRYFGFIPLGAIHGSARPLWVW